MTEKQAWLTIAKAYETLFEKRTVIQRGLTCSCGICQAVNRLEVYNNMTQTKIRTMCEKIMDCTTATKPFFCAINQSNEKLRADFCYLMYYMLEYPNEV